MTELDYSTHVTSLQGEEKDLSEYKGKVLLIVNTASKCGFTPQYTGLEDLYKGCSERGLVVLGFPCNQFGKQEPGEASTILTFCQANYGVSFPMHTKIEVNGANTHPLYRQLKTAKPGVLGTKAIKWNFTKFLVGRDGTILERFGSKVAPSELKTPIEHALRQKQ